MAGYKLCSFHFTKQFTCITANIVIIQFHHFNLSFRIDNECTAISHTFFFDIYTQCTTQSASRVCQHRVLNLANAFRSIMPSFVHEMRVSTYRIDFYTHRLELIVLFSHIHQFSRTYESKVSRIEEKNRPFTFQVIVGYSLESSVVKSLNTEFRKLRI